MVLNVGGREQRQRFGHAMTTRHMKCCTSFSKTLARPHGLARRLLQLSEEREKCRQRRGHDFVWFNVRQHNNSYIDVSFWERKHQLRG
jgi:hypothetical protein